MHTHITYIHRRQALPSSFLSRQQKRKKAAKGSKIFTYDRDILCLPHNCMVGNSVPIPCSKHMRDFLASNGLIGKIRLSSSMTEEEIMSEIRSVFSVSMRNESNFAFKILQPSGGSSKSLLFRPPLNGQLQPLLGKIARCEYMYWQVII